LVAIAATNLNCASAQLSPDASDRYQKTWAVAASPDEVVDSVVAAISMRRSVRVDDQTQGNGEAVRIVEREDRPEWYVLKTDGTFGTAWLKYRAPKSLPHDVLIRLYGSADGKRVLFKAVSRSRLRLFDYKKNRRILSSLTALMEDYWSHHGIHAEPSAPAEITSEAR